MYFQYDTSGIPLGFTYNGEQYFYLTNNMGDVIAITYSDGEILAEYVYDEWGNVLDSLTSMNTALEWKIANVNPLRYRGYYYDEETGYYYLQSRYYDPSICRFINADDTDYVDKDTKYGTNIFAYCDNDPINNTDPTGFWDKIKVHNGYNPNGKAHYYYTFINNYSTPYGTYCWAIGCGFNKSNAKKAWNKNKRDTALKYLGYGLHAVQDQIAHGQIGRGLNIPQHIVYGKGNKNLLNYADNIDYVWKNKSQTKLEKNSKEKTRLVATANATREYLNNFVSYIGGKGKI